MKTQKNTPIAYLRFLQFVGGGDGTLRWSGGIKIIEVIETIATIVTIGGIEALGLFL